MKLGGGYMAFGGGAHLIDQGLQRIHKAEALSGVGSMWLGEKTVDKVMFMHKGRIAAGLGLVLGATAVTLLNAVD